MTTDTVSTRRSLLKGGALLAAPLAVASPIAAAADDGRYARLALLEDEAALRLLHQTWLQRINAGARDDAAQLFADPRRAAFDKAISSIAATGEPDTIAVSRDGQSASGRFACAVEIETEMSRDCTLAQMAHAQGGGVIRRTERRVLKTTYVKARDNWAIARIELVSG